MKEWFRRQMGRRGRLRRDLRPGGRRPGLGHRSRLASGRRTAGRARRDGTGRPDAPGPVAAGQLCRPAGGRRGRPALQPLQRRLRRPSGLRQPRRGPAAGRRRRAVAAAQRRPARLDAAPLPARRLLRLGVAAGAVRQPGARLAKSAHSDTAGQRHAGADGPSRRVEALPQAGRTDRHRAGPRFSDDAPRQGAAAGQTPLGLRGQRQPRRPESDSDAVQRFPAAPAE